MSKKELAITDRQVQEVMIEALKYNAAIVAAASLYFGNCNNPRVQKTARKHFLDIMNGYDKNVMSSLGIERSEGCTKSAPSAEH